MSVLQVQERLWVKNGTKNAATALSSLSQSGNHASIIRQPTIFAHSDFFCDLPSHATLIFL